MVPKEGGTPEQSLASLGRNFNLDDVIVKGLIKEKIANLEEFRFFFHDGSQVDTWVSKIGLTDDKMVQVARLRRAWSAVSLFYQTAEQDRSKVVAADLDSMLDEGELRDSKTAFWKRYRLKFPTEVHPADTTVSRVSRELSKRMLCVFNLWKVKTLHIIPAHNQSEEDGSWERTSTPRRSDEDEPCQSQCGVLPRSPLHPPSWPMPFAGVACHRRDAVCWMPTKEATLGADSTEFSAVPLDVCMSYWFRAKRTCYQVPLAKRMAMATG